MRLIRELFENPVTYKVITSDDDQFIAEFHVEDIPYDFQAWAEPLFTKYTKESSHDMVVNVIVDNLNSVPIQFPFEIEFGINSNEKGMRRFNKGKARFGISNTGNATIVFSTVKQIMKEFLNVCRPDVFYFTSKEDSRTKLYRLIYDKASQIFPGYTGLLKTWYPPSKETIFIFRRK